MCLCNPAVKQPAAALCSSLYLSYPTDTLYKPRTHPVLGIEPETNRDEPDFPKIHFQDRYKYTNTVLACQYIRKLLTVRAVNVLLCTPFSTWQAGHTRKSMRIFVWNRYRSSNWRAVYRWTVPELGEQCSDPDRNHFRQIWLVGIIPNPYDRTSASCVFLRNT